jgi:glutamyl-tRNA reductase
MLARLKAQEITPAIVSLREQLEEIRLAEIEKMRAKLGPLTLQQEEALEALDARDHQQDTRTGRCVGAAQAGGCS